MPVNTQQLRHRLREFDFTGVMVEELGWNYHQANLLPVTVDGQNFDLHAVAEKSGLVVYSCDGSGDGQIPSYPIRQKIERQVAKATFEHLVIFHDAARTTQYWQWVHRQSGKPAAWREQVYRPNQTEELLIQKLQSIEFQLEDEEQQNIALVTGRVRGAFDVDRVTKRFYDRFKSEHDVFLGFIEGMDSLADREWYASLMLNRLMFVYFIQKKGFLDDDPDYMRDRLEMIRQADGKDKFQRFYRLFLLRLFHEGLGQPESNRAPELAQLLGSVPYLNGGLFEVHDLENENPDIHIPDEAFEKLFDFFDGYSWHLDERPLRADNEINPDVLGFIFEKYINQKELGAYYTKEDITGYISRNSIIPSLFDAACKECPVAFQSDGGVWRLLQEEPDRYIYQTVKKGMGLTLPPEIAAGLDDVTERQGWNSPAPEEFALPTETWREVVARRKHYEDVFLKLADGAVNDIKELITLNLDISRFAQDVIIQSEGPELVKAYWDALEKVSILDPACGSGAFLFAALNVLEPLYTACLEGMRGFLDDLERSGRPNQPEALKPFRDVLDQLAMHPNQRYFVHKSIVINNLYGVDMVEEAVEICKLRLFLKLVAQVETYEEIEPLPDIDFNVRAGNSLVGFTSLDALREAMRVTATGQARMLSAEDEKSISQIEEEAEIADRAYQMFRNMQSLHGMDAIRFAEAKTDLRGRLNDLRSELDRYLANQYGVEPQDGERYGEWHVSHQPFHWFVEFYGVLNHGGFDVVIGNPPYLELREVHYSPGKMKCSDTGAIHSLFIERSIQLLKKHGCVSMIVPMSLVSTQRMRVVQELLEDGRNVWYSNYSWRPAKLFDTVNRALTIFVAKLSAPASTFSTNYQKWTSDCREELTWKIRYEEIPKNRPGVWVPKLGHMIEGAILGKCLAVDTVLSRFMSDRGHQVFYRTTGGLYWKVFTDFPPKFVLDGRPGHSTRETAFSLSDSAWVKPVIALLSSDLFWWWYTLTSNCRDLNPYDIRNFPCPTSVLTDPEMTNLGDKYLKDIEHNSTMAVRLQKQTGRTETQSFKIQMSKSLINDINTVLAGHYGFTNEEVDFLINYDIKYRIGQESNND